MSFTSAPFQALFFFSQKVPGKGVSFTSALFQALFIFSQKVPGKKVFLTSAPFKALCYFSQKVPVKKCLLLPHLSRHFSSFHKKCLAKKSAYSAPLGTLPQVPFFLHQWIYGSPFFCNKILPEIGKKKSKVQ